MPSYNYKQKLYIALAIGIFLTINLIGFLLAIPTLFPGKVQGSFTDNTSEAVLINGEITKKFNPTENEEISTNTETLFLRNVNFIFLALPQSKTSFGDIDSANVQFGVGYIENYTEFDLRLKDWSITLSPSSKVIFDSSEGTITVLKGSIKIAGKEFYAGFIASLNDPELKPSVINKDNLFSTNKAKEINKILISKTIFLPEINFNSKPLLNIAGNQQEIITNENVYRISGNTSKLNSVYINNQPIEVNQNGEFSKVLPLSKGINYFEITVVDELASTYTKNIKIILNN
ncbi:MAG: hypothetical protein ABI721_00775 [Candidatus Dojkabacteria bacterium]